MKEEWLSNSKLSNLSSKINQRKVRWYDAFLIPVQVSHRHSTSFYSSAFWTNFSAYGFIVYNSFTWPLGQFFIFLPVSSVTASCCFQCMSIPRMRKWQMEGVKWVGRSRKQGPYTDRSQLFRVPHQHYHAFPFKQRPCSFLCLPGTWLNSLLYIYIALNSSTVDYNHTPDNLCV